MLPSVCPKVVVKECFTADLFGHIRRICYLDHLFIFLLETKFPNDLVLKSK